MQLQPFAERLSVVARKLTFSPYFYLFLPAAFLLLPLRWILGWALAVAVHEWGHYLALRICRIRVLALEVTPFGILMHTEPLKNREALFCALAGPFCGVLLIGFSGFLPYTAICAFLQTVFNPEKFFPIFPEEIKLKTNNNKINIFFIGSSLIMLTNMFHMGYVSIR